MDAIAIADAYWAEFFGTTPYELFQVPFQIVPHHQELSDYHGAYGLFRHDHAILSLPPSSIRALASRLESQPTPVTPDTLIKALANVAQRIVGPAWIGYATAIPHPTHPCRPLVASDELPWQSLRDACDATEWDHGGSSLAQPCSGAFVDDALVAVAGYEVWGQTIAHISVATHPAHRGHSYGYSTVAHLAQRPLRHGLLPQYRTLLSNHASLRIGESLGFQKYAVSLAIRF